MLVMFTFQLLLFLAIVYNNSGVMFRCPGFIKLKMQNKNGLPVAFVDFQVHVILLKFVFLQYGGI